MKKSEVAHLIDHTILKPEATSADVARIVDEGARFGTYSVCVSPSMLPLEVPEGLKVACVVGFPSGAVKPNVKAYEAKQAIDDGADEIDMVINIGALKSKNLTLVEEDIQAVVDASGDRLVKVIIETCLLTETEKVVACQIAKLAGADFVKTSTGFSTGGATVEDVALMRQVVGPDMGVKASGGTRSYEDAQAMIQAGANRIGTSSGVAIMKGEVAHGDY